MGTPRSRHDARAPVRHCRHRPLGFVRPDDARLLKPSCGARVQGGPWDPGNPRRGGDKEGREAPAAAEIEGSGPDGPEPVRSRASAGAPFADEAHRTCGTGSRCACSAATCCRIARACCAWAPRSCGRCSSSRAGLGRTRCSPRPPLLLDHDREVVEPHRRSPAGPITIPQGSVSAVSPAPRQLCPRESVSPRTCRAWVRSQLRPLGFGSRPRWWCRSCG
jgi:hypothetical protein